MFTNVLLTAHLPALRIAHTEMPRLGGCGVGSVVALESGADDWDGSAILLGLGDLSPIVWETRVYRHRLQWCTSCSRGVALAVDAYNQAVTVAKVRHARRVWIRRFLPSMPPCHVQVKSRSSAQLLNSLQSETPMQLPLTSPGLTSMSTTDRRKGVAQLTVHIPDAAARTPPPTSRSRWSTLEFRLYALAFAVVVPLMVWVPISLSSGQSLSSSLRREPSFTLVS